MEIKVKHIMILVVLSLTMIISLGCSRKKETPQQPPALEKETEHNSEVNEDNKEYNGSKEVDNKDKERKVLLKLDNQEGKEITLQKDSDQLLILSFWVDWAPQSKAQLKVLENVYPLMQDDVRFIGIHATGFEALSKEIIKDKINQMQYSFPMLLDENLEAQQKYYVGAFPTVILIDYEGNVIQSFTSLIEEEELLDLIEATLETIKP